jgi:hypothetical protein
VTTKEAEARYLNDHLCKYSGRKFAMFNPLDRDVNDLPTIFGFNNGGSHSFLHAILIAEDGTELGSHLCSDEGYMPSDLGCLEGTRSDRHEEFKKHYPDGYKMEFIYGVTNNTVPERLLNAINLANEKNNAEIV